ncbi:MAG: hypothetical protein ABJX32_04030 [Tateyamaria sp.]|uniref:hypothetical protein n=1 Tax=Tateyamaria sp. TaxID=1929288 RepID=UPI00329DD50F
MKQFALVLPFICAACSAPEPIFASSRGITYNNVTSSQLSEITLEAEKHCARYDMNAKPGRYQKTLGIAEFSCQTF